MADTYKTRRARSEVDEWLTVTQAAAVLGITAHTLREWTARGVVEAARTAGGHRRYRRADLERFAGARGDAGSFEDLHHRLADLATLADVSQAVFSSLALEELLPIVCQKLVETTGCTGAVVSEFDAESDDVVTLWEHGSGDPAWRRGTRYSLRQHPMTRRVVRHQEPYVANVTDPASDAAERRLLAADGNQSVLILPLVYRGKTIGIAECYDTARERAHSPGELALARAICDRIAVAVHNARLYERVRRQNDDRALMLDATRAIASGKDLHEVLETLARRVTEALGVAWCDIYDYDPVSAQFTVVAFYQLPSLPPADGWLGTSFDPGEWSDLRRALDRHETTVTQASDPALPENVRSELDRWGEKSTMTVPLLDADGIVGVMDIAESRGERQFSRSDREVVEAIALQAATTVRTMRLLDETRRRNRELQLLLDTGQVIASSMDLPEALGKVTEWLTHSLDVAWADIYTYDADSDTLKVIAFYQIEGVAPADGWLGTSFASDTLSRWHRSVHERRTAVIYADDPDLHEPDRADMEQWGELATLAVPLLYRDEVIGLLDVAESRYQRRFGEDEVRLVSALANQLGVAVHNLRLFEATRRRSEELSAMLRISETVTSSSDVETVLDTVVGTLRESLDLSWCEIYDFEPHLGILSLAAHSYLEPVDYGDWDATYSITEAPTLAAAVADKRPLVAYIDDPELPPDTRRDMERWGDKASLYVPMVYGGEVMGVVYGAELRSLRRFSDDDLRLATLMAAQAAAVIEMARGRARELEDHEQLARFNRRLSTLVEFSAQMRGLVEVEHLVALLGRVVTEALELRQWAVYLYDEDGDRFTVSAARGVDPSVSGHYEGLVVPGEVMRGLTEDATRISASFFVDHRRHRWSERENEFFRSTDFGSGVEGEWHTDDTLFVPMISEKGQLLGYLEAYDPVDHQLPDEDLVRHLEVFAGKAASSLELLRLHRRLEEEATTDGLTGLVNHRHLLQRVGEEAAKARRYGTPLSLLMIDIDDFKPFNDTYGHPQGDKVLQEVARILRGGVRQKVDLVARYGGEEFVVLLPSTPSRGAEVAAERLREGIAESRTAEAVAETIRKAMAEARFEGYPRRKEVPVTVSIGVAQYPDHAESAEELIVNSDRALYVAKRQGKNRTCIYGVD
jgi:diguanylate cyclase (GGDEF)-like protein/excisionase family DNA binding protein